MNLFADTLNRSMSSSPPPFDPNIDPTLQPPQVAPPSTPSPLGRLPNQVAPANSSAQISSTQISSTQISSTPSVGPPLSTTLHPPPSGAAPSTDPADDTMSSSDDDEGQEAPEEDDPDQSEGAQFVRELARQKSLSHAATQSLMTFKGLMMQRTRDLYIYAQVLAIGDAIGAGAAWTPSPEAARNIQKYTHSVLLSPELTSYRGSSTARVVMEVLKKVPCQLPHGWSSDPHKTELVMKCVNSNLTQQRADLKKKILASIPKTDSDRGMDIADLCIILGGGSITMTAPHWARVAFLRGVITTNSDSTFWKKVDEDLKNLRDKALAKAKGDVERSKKKMHKLLKSVLEIDYQLYGNPVHRHVVPSKNQVEVWQSAADQAAAGALAAPVLTKRKRPSE